MRAPASCRARDALRRACAVGLVTSVIAVTPAPAGAVDQRARDRVPAPAGPAAVPLDPDGDGLALRTLATELDDVVVVALEHHDEAGHEETGHDDGPREAPGALVAVPSQPELAFIEDVSPGTRLALRTRSDGSWDDWFEVGSDEFEAPDGRPGEEGHGGGVGVGPIWLGNGVDQVEVAVLEGEAGPIEFTEVHLVEPTQAPAHPSDGPRGVRGFRSAASTVTTGIKPRSSWAYSSMGWACSGTPSATAELNGVIVHHTAGTNSYSAGQVPGIIRAIWYYHVQSRGWCDIAYNFLVDQYGGIWEGRQGGIDRAIIGGHTYGYNTGTSGVAQLGDFSTRVTPAIMTRATMDVTGWKLAHHGVEPTGTTQYTNRSGTTVKSVPSGGSVTLPRVIGHRDLGQTTCPGGYSYNTLASVRKDVAAGAHLWAIHEHFLRAVPTPAGYARWMVEVRARGLRETALSMARSRTYAGLIITDMYRRVFNREPDAEGMAYWLDQIAKGTRIEVMGVYFYGSEEYYRAAGTPEEYVRALYNNLLHREPEPQGFWYWTQKLRSGTPPPVVAHSFYFSEESRRDRVSRLYLSILGRTPDSAGHAYWADQLRSIDDIVLAVELTLSREFYMRATG